MHNFSRLRVYIARSDIFRLINILFIILPLGSTPPVVTSDDAEATMKTSGGKMACSAQTQEEATPRTRTGAHRHLLVEHMSDTVTVEEASR